jgi:hypothetical protein
MVKHRGGYPNAAATAAVPARWTRSALAPPAAPVRPRCTACVEIPANATTTSTPMRGVRALHAVLKLAGRSQRGSPPADPGNVTVICTTEAGSPRVPGRSASFSVVIPAVSRELDHAA